MPARMGLLLFTFSLIVSFGHRWQLASLQAISLEGMGIITLIGALGLSALLVFLVGLVWQALASGAEYAREPEQHLAAALASSPQGAQTRSDDEDAADLLRGSGLVDADWYIGTYTDVVSAGLDAAHHYLRHGAAEGRKPNPFFDTSWYLDHNPDVQERGINPLVHYIVDGAAEGRPAGPKFDTAFYLTENPDVTLAGVNALAHYLREGRFEGRPGTAKLAV